MGALALLIAARLLADPASPVEPAARSCAPPHVLPHVVMGPRGAPLTIRVYLDPTSSVALDNWLDVRALVGALDGAAAAELVVVRKPEQVWARTRKPDEDRVRHWVQAAATPADAENMLREIDRLGWETIASRLARPEERAALEARRSIESRRLDPACLARDLSFESESLAQLHTRQLGNSSARPPVFGILNGLSGERLITNDPSLRDLKPQVELALQELRAQRARPLPQPPNRRRFSSVPHPVGNVPEGMNVGGIGRPHHLLVYADGEHDPTLPGTLPHAMEFRRSFPDMLSIQVVARGRRDDAVRLRGRLCAARLAGLEVEYLRRLAGAEPGANDLVDRLDLIAQREACVMSDEGTNERGAMLDGVPASGADVRQLHLRLEQESERGPLRWFWPRTDLR